MHDYFNLDYKVDYDDIGIVDIKSQEYLEFCELLEEIKHIDDYKNDFILDFDYRTEAVEYNNINYKGNNKSNKKKGGISGAYSKATDVGALALNGIASVVNLAWNAISKTLEIILKVVNFIIRNINAVTIGIENMIKRMKGIPITLANRIQGNAELYITVEDLNIIYTRGVMGTLYEVLKLSADFSRTNLFKSILKAALPANLKLGNDIKIARTLTVKVNRLSNIEFKKTTIKLHNNEQAISLYFSNEQKISFLNARGRMFTGTYLEAIKMILDQLNDYKGLFEELAQKCGDKFEVGKSSKAFSKLSEEAKGDLASGVTSIGKCISLVGTFIKYIMQDMKTYNDIITALEKAKSKMKNNPNNQGGNNTQGNNSGTNNPNNKGTNNPK